MSAVDELAYVVYEVSDLVEWEHFGVHVLGMQYGEKTDNGFTLRTDEKIHRWVLQQGPADDLVASGWKVSSDADLDAIVERLRAAGLEVTEGDPELVQSRRVQRLIAVSDPMGNRVELVTGFAHADTAFESTGLLGNFVTGAGGAGHEVLLTGNVSRDDYLAFYVDLLGMKISDFIVEELAPGVYADLVFLHCNPRHHTLAMGAMPFPKKMHHYLVEVSDIRDVGRAWDRCLQTQQPIEMTLGMHPNDLMFSFYVTTPSGWNVEYGWGGLLITDEDAWQVNTYDKLDSWGHDAPKRVAESLINGITKGGR